MKNLFALIVLSASLQAFGAPTNTIIRGGASRVIGSDPVTAVWGAMIGVADDSATGPYNNCDEISGGGEDFTGCNPLRVNGDHTITIEFTESENLTQSVAPIAITRQTNTSGSGTNFKPIGTVDPAQLSLIHI